MFGIFAASAAVKAQEAQARQFYDVYESWKRKQALIGRVFKCGPHRWRIEPHMELDLRPGAINYRDRVETIKAVRC